MVVLEAEGLSEELLHDAFFVGLQQGFLLTQLPQPPIHRRQEFRNLPLLWESGEMSCDAKAIVCIKTKAIIRDSIRVCPEVVNRTRTFEVINSVSGVDVWLGSEHNIRWTHHA